MPSVWIVEEGYYSDRHVVGVFDSREAAEALAVADQCEVLEVELNAPINGERPLFVARMRGDEITVGDTMELAVRGEGYVTFWPWDEKNTWHGRDYGATPELARKNLSDRLAAAKAQKAGI